MIKSCPTPKTIMADLEDAADTMSRLPKVRGPRLAQFWPDYIYEPTDYGYHHPSQSRMRQPTAEALTKMDICMEWLRWLEADVAKLLWMRAEKMPWRIICQVYGAPKSTAILHWRKALLTIQDKLLQNTSCKTFPAKSFSKFCTD